MITVTIFGIVWKSARSVLTRMLDGVVPGLVNEIHHAAEHVSGSRKMVDAKAFWLGHKLHVDVEIAVNDGLLLPAENNIAASLKAELFAHIPTLDVATVRFAEPQMEGGHHHAPDAFLLSGKLASGLLEIVVTCEMTWVKDHSARHRKPVRLAFSLHLQGWNQSRAQPL